MKVILFDGDCHFCNRSVQFIMKRDPHGIFHFASRQSDIGQTYLNNLKIAENVDSLIFIDEDKYFIYSTAALNICKDLQGLWKWCALFLIIPRPLRDFCYKVIARNRHRLFKSKATCQLPSAKERQRFIDKI